MKNTLTILFVLCVVFVAKAQTYTGKIQDSSGLPVSYANVIAKKEADSTTLKTAITDNNGVFKIKVEPKGSFYIEISYLGFKTKRINPKQPDLGIIKLENGDIKLSTVEATSRKKLVEQKADRMVFNVENSVAANGGTALDVLKKTPGVNVENENIAIVGKGSVRVLINDRIIQLSGEDLVNYLSTMASDDIKNIEVITTPPAKYEAEGNSGLINIVLKETRKNSWNNQVRASYIQGTYPIFNLGNTFNYNHEKLKITASLDGKKGYDYTYLTSKVYYPNEIWFDDINIKNKEDYVSGRVGVDYDLTPNTTLGILYSGRISDPNDFSHGTTHISNLAGGKSQINNSGETSETTDTHSFNVHYLQKLDTLGRKLSVDLDYFTFNKDQDRIFGSKNAINYLTRANNKANQAIDNYSAKVDMEHPFSWANMSYGAKFTRTQTNSATQYFNLISGTPVLDLKQTDDFKYTEDISALYWDISKSFGEKWQTKFGLRLENTKTEGESKTYNQTDKRNYNKLFPTAYVSYATTPNHVFNFSYSKRINRPSFWALNPFRWYINANSYSVGNPSLQPQINDNFELKYIYKSKFITELFANFSDEGSGQVITVDADKNQIVYGRENYYKGVNYGVKQTALYNPFKWWNTTSQLTAFRLDAKYINNIDLGTPILNGWGYQFYTNQIFLLNAKGTTQLEATYYYQSSAKSTFAEVSSVQSLNLGMKMQFLSRDLQLSVSVNDIFKTSTPEITVNTNNIKQVYNQYNDNRYVKVGLSYKFGNKKIRVQERDLGNEEELNRVQ